MSGSASGMGAATCTRLKADGLQVIGIDRHDAEIVADLSTSSGRSEAIDAVRRIAGDAIDGLVTWAGVAGLSNVPGSLLASVNYFGTVELLEGLRPLVGRGRCTRRNRRELELHDLSAGHSHVCRRPVPCR